MRTRSPSRASSVTSADSSSDSEGTSESDEQEENVPSEALTEKTRRELTIFGDKLVANTRSMMSLEKSILTRAGAVATLTRTMRTGKRTEHQTEQRRKGDEEEGEQRQDEGKSITEKMKKSEEPKEQQ